MEFMIGDSTIFQQRMKSLQFSYLLAIRQNFSTIHYGGKLFQQYIVDAYVKTEQNRLAFHRQNQKALRVELYQGLMDHLANEAVIEGLIPGHVIILPSSFHGSPRAMQQNYQDAMAIVQKYGKPDLFITFICNPTWIEIEEQLFPGQTPFDRPDLITRVFKLKLNELIDDIFKKHILGRTIANVFVSKGHDCANIKLQRPVQEGAAAAQETFEWDEIKTHFDARYMSVPEATWKLFEFPSHDKSHAVIRLAVHLPNQRPVYFAEGKERQALERAVTKDTTLTAWFKLNSKTPDARQYLYHDIPQHFVFERSGTWKHRLQGEMSSVECIPSAQ
ncbi:unnamed protein product [Rotaria sp. Silwood2]|nr:unnamed protein product [Rotaria sp. Silwood2]